ncbi:MAG: E3 ubiquitin ligase family protein, partial [Dehalococcoidia bacterium]|nr:E3 ubiquitin ligase family protein [Dehalococcoidia bacterium]
MSSGVLPVLSIVLGGLGAIGCLIGAFRALRRRRLIDDVPTSKTQGVFIGLAELKGTAESEMPLTSYLAGTRCVQYAWQIDEHWSRTVHETYTDAKGQTHTRTRTESGWTKVAGDSQSIPFYLKDDTGVIRVVPEGA